jgi:long-chain acyl-CoA synthetase
MAELRTLQHLIDRLVQYGEKPALIWFREQGAAAWSRAELYHFIQRLARGLIHAGLQRGDRVALLASNSPEWIAASLAVVRAGGMAAPLDVQLSDEALVYALEDSAPNFVITATDHLERIRRPQLKAEIKPILIDVDRNHELSLQRFFGDTTIDLPETEPEDVAALFYTSGTTGRLKGVPLSHANIAFQVNRLLQTTLLTAGDRVLLPLPLHHVYPFVIGMLMPLAMALPIVLPQALTGPQIIRAIREAEVSVVIGVPRVYRAFFSGIETRFQEAGAFPDALFRISLAVSMHLLRKLHLRIGKALFAPLHKRLGPKLRILASGGSALDPDLAGKLEGLGWQVAIGYGLTETAPLLTLNLPGEAPLESVGRLIEGVEILIDPAPLPQEEQRSGYGKSQVHEEGEILARGPNVFSGYLHMPEQTRKAFTADGWFRTGDLGYFDRNGCLYLTGRLSTLIVTEGGKNIQPEEVEEAYGVSPAIAEIGVLETEGRLAAVIVPETGRSQEQDKGALVRALRAAVAEQSRRLPSYQRITDYVISFAPLPRTRLGKIRRHLLRDIYEQGMRQAKKQIKAAGTSDLFTEAPDSDLALLNNPAARKTWEWLNLPRHGLSLDTSPQLDLGIDSLGWLDLTFEISRHTGVELGEEAITRIETVRDLLCEVVKGAETGDARPYVSPLEQPEQALSKYQKRWLKPQGSLLSATARMLWAVNYMLMRVLFRLQVRGVEHVLDRSGMIIAPNHTSYLDALILSAALGLRGLRRTYWAGWTGVVFSSPLGRFISRIAQTVPIDSDRAVVSSLAYAAAVLRRGERLIWFPEGQRSKTGRLLPFKPGIGMLVEHFQVDVAPVFIKGTYEAMPTGVIVPRLKPVTVVFARPLAAHELERRGKGPRPRDRIVQALHEHMEEMERSVRLE